ncbi:MAG: hypothetical protein AB7G44_04685 [Bacteroidia bacterium]
MEALLLQNISKKDLEIFELLAKKIGIKTRHLNEDELEEIGLANAMKKGRTGKFVNTATYLKKLEGK